MTDFALARRNMVDGQLRPNRVTNAQFDEFAHDLHDFFATGARVETGGPSRPATPAMPKK